MKRRILALVLGGLLGAGGASAQTLLDVYDLARQYDPTIREVREQVSSARESKPQAKALLLPNVGVVGNSDWVSDDTKKSFTGSRSENYNQYNLQLQVKQPVYRRDYWLQLEQTDNTIAQAEAQLAAAEIDLMVRTATSYFNVLAAADDLRTAIAEKEANARQLEQAQQRFDVGLIAITDVHESQASYDGAVASVIVAENALSSAWEALRQIVGDTSVPLAKLGEELPMRSPDPNDIEKWAETAQAQNYGIIAAREAAELSKKGIEVQRSGHYPTLDLVGSYGTANSFSSFGTERDTGVIGLQLNVPIYAGGGVDSRTRQAQYDYQAAQERLDQQRRAVNRQVRDSYRGVLSTISRVQALASTVVSFQSALESTQAGLEVGTRTMVDVLTVTRSLYQAQRDYARARYDYIVNGLLLHQAASSLSPELLAKANGWLVPDDTVPPPL